MTTQAGLWFGHNQPVNIPVTDRLYRLIDTYQYHWLIDGVIYRIEIPAGFEWDGASVPRLVWTLSGLRPDGLIRAAALVHDFLYEHEGALPFGAFLYNDDSGMWQDAYGYKWPRRDADRMFARIMRECEVSKLKRRLAYLAVRAGGWLYWREW